MQILELPPTRDELVESALARPVSTPHEAEEQSFIGELPRIINRFRFQGTAYDPNPAVKPRDNSFYGDLSAQDKRKIPPVEAQVVHAESAIVSWIGEVATYAGQIDRDPEDHAFHDLQEQGKHLLAVSQATGPVWCMWLKDYDRKEDNKTGRYVDWFARRATRQVAQKVAAPIIAEHTSAYAHEGSLFRDATPDISKISKHPEVRRTAYDKRMDAKVGLACMRIEQLLKWHFDMPQIDDIFPQSVKAVDEFTEFWHELTSERLAEADRLQLA